jgi:squalene-hopene/tetraprenyl-beta-curcumene cyclase
MKKPLAMMIIALLCMPMVSVVMPQAKAASTSMENPSVLEFNSIENLEILQSGAMNLRLYVNVPASPLAEMYRRALGASNGGAEEEVSIPENGAETVVPIREEFYKALSQEYESSLGLNMAIVDSSMVPRGGCGECRIYAEAHASPRVLGVTENGASDTWTLGIGPTDYGAFAEYLLTKVTFEKMLLEELPGEQIYRSSSSIKITLPADATLLDYDEIAGLNWLVDLGGGNCLKASLSVDKAIVLNETIVVTEQNTTATPTEIRNEFLNYRTFKLKYSLPHSGNYPKTNAAVCEDDFSWSRTVTLIDKEYPWPVGPFGAFSATMTAHVKLDVDVFIGWEPTAPIFSPLRSFQAWIKPHALVEVMVDATVSSNYENEWAFPIPGLSANYPFTVFIGPVPVEVDVSFSVEARLKVSFSAALSIKTGAKAYGWFIAGVQYDSSLSPQWSRIFDHDTKLEYIPPTTEISAEAEVRPSLAPRIEMKFYKALGPYVEFELYASAKASATGSTFELHISVGLTITAGVSFEEHLKKLLDLKDPDPITILDIPIGEFVWKTHHDIAVTSVEVSKTKVFPGESVEISVTVKNQGVTFDHKAESFDVKVSYDDTLIDTEHVSQLAEGAQTTLGFVWDTKNVPPKEYKIKAEAINIVPAEEYDEYKANNIYTFSAVDISPLDFYITLPKGNWYKPGETTQTTVSVTNLRNARTTFWLGASFRDPNGESDKYNPEISTNPPSATLNPAETASFTVTWTTPLDAPVGQYQVALNCWKDNTYREKYTDNIEWADVFYAYKLHIQWPITLLPTSAGDPNNPNTIYVCVRWIPTALSQLLDKDTAFSIKIGDQPATFEPADFMMLGKIFGYAGVYTLRVTPPTQLSPGLYDLTVTATLDQLADSDTEPNAVNYVAGPPTEPIQKGLAWLRTRQYGDGSWSNNVAVTSLAALAFLNAGYDETDATVSKAISYILGKVHSDGSIYTSYSVYETSIAILSLVATHNESYAIVIENGKNWLVGAQQDEDFGYMSTSYEYGGWTYWSGKGDPDLSNTQFALMALDAANLPKTDPAWSKAIIFTQRCQNRPASNDQAWAHDSTQPSYNDGGFIYRPWGWSLAGGTISYGSMTGAGIWGLLLSGVPKTDERVVAAINWVVNHYSWDTNPGIGWWRMYYYYLSMSKALTMYGEPLIDGHDWYHDLYDKIVGMQIDAGSGEGYWSTTNEDYVPDLTTAYAILSLETRAVAPPVKRLSYLTFILRSNCLLRIIDPDGNLVGYNYMAGLGENQISNAIYSGSLSDMFCGSQYIVIVNPKPGTYKLELVGISQGQYTLTIQGNYGEEVTKTYEYTGDIGPAELHGSQVTVTAIVGPIDIYTNPPEFDKIIDIIPPKTTLAIGKPKYTDATNNIYITSATPLTLTAEDNIGGTGLASTYYRIYNTTGYDTGLITSTPPIGFYLTGIDDGEYFIDFYSVDNIGNIEPTTTQNVILDNTPPITTPTIGDPKYVSGGTYVTPDTPFTLVAKDTGSGVYSIAYRIYNTTYNSGWRTFTAPFKLTSLTDGTYTIEYNSTDNVGNVEPSKTVDVALVRAKWLKQDALNQLNSLLPTGNKKVDGKIMEAAGKIKQSLGTTPWIDENHPNPKYGKQVFDKEKEAVLELMIILRGTDATQTVKNKIRTVIDELVQADKEIALIAIFDAKAKGSTDCRVIHEIKEADEEYSEALNAITKGNYDHAVKEFEHAWIRAQHAMKKQFGDVDADGKVNLMDCIIVANAFGSCPGQRNWNPMADLNGDNKVDMKDCLIICANIWNVYN